jgi:hypothetical protein
MKRIEDECVDCGLPCLGRACRYRAVPHWFCDECGQEFNPDELYAFDGQELCEECLKDILLERAIKDGDAIKDVDDD